MTKTFSQSIPLLILLSLLFSNVSKAKTLEVKSSKKITVTEDFDEEDFDLGYSSKVSEVKDPFEKWNRKIYKFNDNLDYYLFSHVAIAYRQSLSKPIRKSIRNFVTNLSLPLSVVNSLLQGKVDNGLATLSHFLINTTLGVVGLFDIAGEKNIRYSYEDFGQTMGHYGVNAGAYLMLPFLGPSSGRDFGGWLVDKSVDPLGFGLIEVNGQEEFIEPEYRLAISAITALDKRESLLEVLDDVRRESFDPYATIRSAYSQKRENEVKN